MVPHLVQSETPILYFLRSQQWDPHTAANRLVKFWKYRQDFFGERYLLPMVQTGRGALEEADIKLLRLGLGFMVGPCNGTLCLVVNLSRVTHFMNECRASGIDVATTINRICYYFCTIYGDVGSACRDVVVCHVITPVENRPAMEIRLQLWEMARTSSPMPMDSSYRSVPGLRTRERKAVGLSSISHCTSRLFHLKATTCRNL